MRLLVGSVAIGELAAAVAVLGSAGCVGSCGGSCGVFVAAFSSAAGVCVCVWVVGLLAGRPLAEPKSACPTVCRCHVSVLRSVAAVCLSCCL